MRYLFDRMNVHRKSFFIHERLIHPRVDRLQLGTTRPGGSYNPLDIASAYLISKADTLESQMYSLYSHRVERVDPTDYRRARQNDSTNRVA